jgi:ppGpp synthetase/RelA/SpoT-type nucleotidyltranferase
METLRIDIINPKAKKILKELAELNLINIQEKASIKSFESLLSKLRTKGKGISLEEITKEVGIVRSKRYGKKG